MPSIKTMRYDCSSVASNKHILNLSVHTALLKCSVPALLVAVKHLFLEFQGISKAVRFNSNFPKSRASEGRECAVQKHCHCCNCPLIRIWFFHVYGQALSRPHARSSSCARSGRAPTTTSPSGTTPSSALWSASSLYPSSGSGSCRPAAAIAGC